MRDMIKTTLDISIQDILALSADFQEDRFDRIMATAPRSKAVTIGLKAGFPFGFQGLLDQRLVSAVLHDGDTKRALLRLAGFGNPHPSDRLGLDSLQVIRVKQFSQSQAFYGGEGFHAIDARCFLALVVL